jgi:hypothetical protein
MPAQLRNIGGVVRGKVALPCAGAAVPPLEQLLDGVDADASVAVQHLAFAGFDLTNLDARLRVQNGKLGLTTGTGTLLNLGGLQLDLQSDLTRTATMPFQLQLQWRGGKVAGETAALLRYAVPLLAGLQGEAANFTSGIDLSLELQGAALPQTGQSWLQLLNTWQGSGDIALANGEVLPAPALQGLLSFLGQQGKLAIDRLAGGFTLQQGTVESKLMRWVSKGRDYGLTGKVQLDGKLDFRDAAAAQGRAEDRGVPRRTEADRRALGFARRAASRSAGCRQAADRCPAAGGGEAAAAEGRRRGAEGARRPVQGEEEVAPGEGGAAREPLLSRVSRLHAVPAPNRSPLHRPLHAAILIRIVRRERAAICQYHGHRDPLELQRRAMPMLLPAIQTVMPVGKAEGSWDHGGRGDAIALERPISTAAGEYAIDAEQQLERQRVAADRPAVTVVQGEIRPTDAWQFVERPAAQRTGDPDRHHAAAVTGGPAHAERGFPPQDRHGDRRVADIHLAANDGAAGVPGKLSGIAVEADCRERPPRPGASSPCAADRLAQAHGLAPERPIAGAVDAEVPDALGDQPASVVAGPAGDAGRVGADAGQDVGAGSASSHVAILQCERGPPRGGFEWSD